MTTILDIEPIEWIAVSEALPESPKYRNATDADAQPDRAAAGLARQGEA